MKFKLISFILIIGTLAMGQDAPVASADSNDLKVGDIAPSWALMYAPGKFEFLKNWTEEEGKRLRKFQSQPDRYGVLMSFFATWCVPCMKELPILEEVYQKYKDERIKFFLVDITEATRNNPGEVYGMAYKDVPKAGPFLKEKGVTMQILYDTRGTAMKRYNAQILPRLFMMDGNRKITLTRKGFHEGQEEKFKQELSKEIDRLLVELPPLKNRTK
jgi:thiol-disulfide isomerase/thioredoxin|tara:strand:- start:699 stop:1346 length:648 start_codon:yes stop_codon:yes gene_type:complete